MVDTNSPDWLPAGWTVQFNVLRSGRKIRYYENLGTGQKCFSKDDVIQCIKMGSTYRDKPQSTNAPTQRHSENDHLQLVVKPNEYPDWLPDGWTMELKTRKSGARMGNTYKIFVDPLTGCKFYSKPQVFQYLKTLKRKSRVPEQKKTDNMHSAGKVEVEKYTAENLPPGWIKEIRIKKTGSRIRRDPYYTDPVTGYVFRSRKDVARYLETGEISRHAFKPKQINDLELISDEISPSSAAKRHKIEYPATSQQCFAGNDTANLAVQEIGDPKKRESKRLSEDTLYTKENVIEESGEDKETINVSRSAIPVPEAGGSKTRQGKRIYNESLDTKENVIKESAETKDMMNASRSERPRAGGSKENRGKSEIADDGSSLTPAANILQEDLLESGRVKNSNSETQIKERKSKNRKERNLPRRSSNRLAGLEPELRVNAMSSGSALNSATRELNKSEATLAASVSPDNLADGASQQLNVGSEVTHINIPHRELSSKSKNLLEDKPVPEKQPQQLEAEKTDNEKVEAHRFSLFGDSWSYPCLEFAVKTLTGAIPVQDIVDEGLISTPVCDVLQETNLVDTSSNTKTKTNSRKFMKNEEFNFHNRLPKQLAGFQHEQVANSSSEQAFRAAYRRSDSGLAPDPYFTPGGLADVAYQQNEVVRDAALSHNVLTVPNTPLQGEPSNQSKKPLEDQNVTLEPLQKLENEKPEPHSFFPFGDSWSDPCLEFAFKTLTGAIPIDDHLAALQGSLEQPLDTSHRQRISSPALPDFGSSGFFQNDISSHFDTPEKPSTRPQLPLNPSFLPPGNVNLPSCSRNGTEQPACLEGNKEFHGKVKS